MEKSVITWQTGWVLIINPAKAIFINSILNQLEYFSFISFCVIKWDCFWLIYFWTQTVAPSCYSNQITCPLLVPHANKCQFVIHLQETVSNIKGGNSAMEVSKWADFSKGWYPSFFLKKKKILKPFSLKAKNLLWFIER